MHFWLCIPASKSRPVKHPFIAAIIVMRTGFQMAMPEASSPADWTDIMALASCVFSTAAEAQAWLESPHPLLGGRSPTDAGTTREGALKMRDFLVAMKYGASSSCMDRAGADRAIVVAPLRGHSLPETVAMKGHGGDCRPRRFDRFLLGGVLPGEWKS